jgi:hypothetical protein
MRPFCCFTLSLAVAFGMLPAGVYAQGKGQEKVAVCHIPPGNPANARTLMLPQPAVKAHLGHGDTLGACSGGGTGRGGGSQGANDDAPEREDDDDNPGQAAAIKVGRTAEVVAAGGADDSRLRS